MFIIVSTNNPSIKRTKHVYYCEYYLLRELNIFIIVSTNNPSIKRTEHVYYCEYK